MREHFRVPEGTYLLSHSAGCLPVAAEAANAEFLRSWATRGGTAWPDWLRHIDAFCAGLAGLLGGRPHDYCPQTNVSSALVKILQALPPRAGRPGILLSDQDFPSIGFVVQALTRMGYEPRFVSLPLPHSHPGRWVDLWRSHLTPDVQCAVFCHSLYGSSALQPVAALAEMARAQGIWCIADVAQSAGVVPLQVDSWGVDAVIGTSLKWLCGGSGSAFLWIDPSRLAGLEPVDVGWFSHEAPFEMDIHQFRYAPDARRFWGGTPSVLPCALATASQAVLAGIGPKIIRQHNLELTRRLMEGARHLGIPVLTPAENDDRGGTLTLDCPQAFPQLESAGVMVDQRRGYGLRFSPHIYNTEEEIDLVLSLLARR